MVSVYDTVRILLRSSALALPLVLAACSETSPTACTSELRVSLAPVDTAIVVGQSFTASVALSSCGGRQHLSDSVVWRADDTLVVVVNSTVGRVTGRAPGQTLVEATGHTYQWLGAIRVLVAAASP